MAGLDPIIVIGIPRSGTTNVARLLHNHFGVFMGHKFWNPGFAGPDGTYEDLRLMEMNQLFDLGLIKIEPWKRRFRRFVKSRQKLQKPWGFKDPRLIHVLPVALSFFEHPLIIRCERHKEYVMHSQTTKLGWKREDAEAFYDNAQKIMDHVLGGQNYLLVHYPEGVRHKDEKIISALEQIELSYGLN